ncbi:hypothetical protein [Salmonella sp. s51944]|uniref:hypothetical protein n=1 Tax=Salmonella sp. s51944 TaxID=3159655 RepID=UPI00397EE028
MVILVKVVLKVEKDPKVLLVHKDHLVLMATAELSAHQELPVQLVPVEKAALLEQVVLRVMLDSLVTQDLLVHQELKVVKVTKDLKDLVDFKDQMEREVPLETQALVDQMEFKESRVSEVRMATKVMLDQLDLQDLQADQDQSRIHNQYINLQKLMLTKATRIHKVTFSVMTVPLTKP